MSGMPLVAWCPAKVNLSLRVVGRREDGYHELETRFQAIDLWDRIEARADERLTLACEDPAVPCGPENLVLRAASAMRDLAPRRALGAALRLTKRIPVQGGLGGGSSDAAGALLLCARLWGLEPDAEVMQGLARELGADVPFFLQGGTALGAGRGDEIFPVDDITRFGVVLIKPSFGVSTSDAYAWLDADRASAADGPVREPRALDVGWAGHPLAIANDLEGPVARRHPGIEEMIAACIREGAVAAAMTGSGSAVFGLFREAVAAKAARKLQRPDWLVLLTRTLSRRESGRRMTL